MPKEKLKIVMVTSLIWIGFLSSCAGLNIKTWYLDAEEEQALIRRNADGSIKEKISYLQAQGYLCYSVTDDEAWRTRLAQCCAAAKNYN